MSDKTTADRNRLLKKAFKERQRGAEVESSPLPLSELHALLHTVSRLVLDEGGRNLCDHTHRLTRQALEASSKGDVEQVISFLRNKGCYCDCEVALNLGSWLAWNAPEGRA